MTAREMGFLLLTSHLGDPLRKVLTVPQLRLLAQCVTASQMGEKEGQVTLEELMGLGYNRPSAQRIYDLLNGEDQLAWYLEKAQRQGCVPITRVTPGYPGRLRRCLGLDAPGVLWTKGDLKLLEMPAVALVGSRELDGKNLEFAREVGRQAAVQGYVLVSGNARGADRAAQESCLCSGGRVISVVADPLERYPVRGNLLYLSEDGFDVVFSAQRALHRNRIIHSLGQKTFVAKCGFGIGGTWDGTKRNLSQGWSDVFCYNDGSEASLELERMGAQLIEVEQLCNLDNLATHQMRFTDQ